VAPPLIACLGLKRTVLFAMSCYCVYVGCFALAAFVGKEAPSAQLWLFSAASCSGGIAAGVLWTAQGGYFARTVDLLARKEGSERSSLTSSLSGKFAFYLLMFEVVSKLTWSFLDRFYFHGWVIAAGFTLTGATATALMTRSLELSSPNPAGSWTTKAKAAASLWRDPVVFLISGLNLTFGFSAAFMNGYINAHFTAVQIGKFAVPMFAASTALAAALLASLFGSITVRVGKGPVMLLGAASFFCIPASFFALNRCGGWEGWLIVLYVLQGVGRAVYESTSKGIFADFFPDDSVAAFANCMLQSSTAFALCFFLSDVLTGPRLAEITMALAAVTPFGYLAATSLRRHQQQKSATEVAVAADAERALGS